MSAVSYYLLTRTLLSLHDVDSPLAVALGEDLKGRISVGIYLLAIMLAFVNSIVAGFLYVVVAIIWLIPDKRIEKALSS